MAQSENLFEHDLEAFSTVVTSLITDVAEYNAQGEYDEESDSAIRKIRALTAALQGAVMQVAVFRPAPPIPSPNVTPPTPPNPEGP